VTQKQWIDIMGSNPSDFKGCDTCPVEGVSWNDIQNFIEKLNKKTGMTYRLPTEEEWEYAAKGGKESRGYIYAGSDNLDDVAWFSKNSNGKTHAVGEKLPNELGIHDMSGNVWEWCQDWYKPYPGCSGTDRTGVLRVYRGGSWDYGAGNCRASFRDSLGPGYRNFDLGFRLAASAPR
jgi:formylglycine-generating enzyme required for sulfatase activity